MAKTTINELEKNSYPGRGLVVAQTAGEGLCVVYFMTGRSAASRDRVLVRDGDSVYARSCGVSVHDPLRHYRAVAVCSRWCVIGNGDQVDTVAAKLDAMSPPDAVQGIVYEPDPPLRTPRITVIAPRQAGSPLYLSAARASLLTPVSTHLTTLTLSGLGRGCGVLTTTYDRTDSEIDTSRPPVEFATTAESASGLLAAVWDSLPADLRVAAIAIRPTEPDPFALTPRTA